MHLLLFKEPDMQDEFKRLDPKLSALTHWAAAFTGLEYGRPLIVTSVYRKGTSVHNYYRGIDFRVRSFPGGYGQALSDFLNLHTTYDPDRPARLCAIYGANDPHGNHWDHIHLQVCYDNKTAIKFLT